MSHFTRDQIEDILRDILTKDDVVTKRHILHEVRSGMANLEAAGLAPHLLKKEEHVS